MHTAAAHTAEVEFRSAAAAAAEDRVVHTAAEAASCDYCILPEAEVDSLIAGRTRIAAEDRTEAAAEQIEADPVYATSGRAR